MAPIFTNPVNGFIHDGAWVRPSLSHEFKVTSTFAQHVASGRGGGIDIGNGYCGDPVFAMAGGVVSYAGLIAAVDANGKPLPNPAKLVRIRHPQFPGYETGYLHLATIGVSLGQIVAPGQQIGTVGMTGASACHLHGGCKLNGVEIDWWPLLDQNKGGQVTTVTLEVFSPLRQAAFIAGTYRGYDVNTLLQTAVVTIGAAGSSALASAAGQIAPPTAWAPDGLIFKIANGALAGRYVARQGISVPPSLPPPDCSLVEAKLASANNRINSMKAKVAAHAADIADD